MIIKSEEARQQERALKTLKVILGVILIAILCAICGVGIWKIVKSFQKNDDDDKSPTRQSSEQLKHSSDDSMEENGSDHHDVRHAQPEDKLRRAPEIGETSPHAPRTGGKSGKDSANDALTIGDDLKNAGSGEAGQAAGGGVMRAAGVVSGAALGAAQGTFNCLKGLYQWTRKRETPPATEKLPKEGTSVECKGEKQQEEEIKKDDDRQDDVTEVPATPGAETGVSLHTERDADDLETSEDHADDEPSTAPDVDKPLQQ